MLSGVCKGIFFLFYTLDVFPASDVLCTNQFATFRFRLFKFARLVEANKNGKKKRFVSLTYLYVI